VPNGAECPLRLGYFSESDCEIELNPTSLTTACTPIDQTGPAYARVLATAQPGPCPLAGDAGIVKQAPQIGLEVQSCRLARPPTGSGCQGSDIPMTPTNDAVACYRSATASCAAPYTAATTFWPDKPVVDDRACACECHVDGDAGCVGGLIAAYGNGTFCGGPADHARRACTVSLGCRCRRLRRLRYP
jgi:hypothetical protein